VSLELSVQNMGVLLHLKDLKTVGVALCSYLYWSNWMAHPRLERSNLDGTGRKTFVNDIGRVNGITIDFDLGRLFLANIDSNIIESVSLFSGGDRQLVVAGLPHPYGLTQFRDYIYWTDWQTKSIERADKFNGQNRSNVHFSLEVINDVSIFHASRQTGIFSEMYSFNV
jgi:low density lipoprotein receptor-related protein 5/6